MRSYVNSKTITPYRFVVIKDGAIENASASTDNIIGVSDSVGSMENEISDVFVSGELAEIEAGGTFAAGDALTSDTLGKAVKASAGDNIGAIAETDAVAGDIVKVFVVLQRVISSSSESSTDTVSPSGMTEPTAPDDSDN